MDRAVWAVEVAGDDDSCQDALSVALSAASQEADHGSQPSLVLVEILLLQGTATSASRSAGPAGGEGEGSSSEQREAAARGRLAKIADSVSKEQFASVATHVQWDERRDHGLCESALRLSATRLFLCTKRRMLPGAGSAAAAFCASRVPEGCIVTLVRNGKKVKDYHSHPSPHSSLLFRSHTLLPSRTRHRVGSLPSLGVRRSITADGAFPPAAAAAAAVREDAAEGDGEDGNIRQSGEEVEGETGPSGQSRGGQGMAAEMTQVLGGRMGRSDMKSKKGGGAAVLDAESSEAEKGEKGNARDRNGKWFKSRSSSDKSGSNPNNASHNTHPSSSNSTASSPFTSHLRSLSSISLAAAVDWTMAITRSSPHDRPSSSHYRQRTRRWRKDESTSEAESSTDGESGWLADGSAGSSLAAVEGSGRGGSEAATERREESTPVPVPSAQSSLSILISERPPLTPFSQHPGRVLPAISSNMPLPSPSSSGPSPSPSSVPSHSPNTTRYFSPQDILQATNHFSPAYLLGRGSYGHVFKGHLHGCKVAIKKLVIEGEDRALEVQTEVEVLSRVRHPHIVLLMGHCPEEYCVVYEFMAGGNLLQHLARVKGTSWGARSQHASHAAAAAAAVLPPPLTWFDRVRIASEIAGGLLFMHSHDPPIVHRDLKPANILLSRDLISKIADVGLARVVLGQKLSTRSRIAGTIGYIDPDQIDKGEMSTASDVYSLGLIILQLITGLHNVRRLHSLLDSVTSSFCYYLVPAVELIVAHADLSAGDWPEGLLRHLALLALRCAEMKRTMRPQLAEEVLPKLVAMATAAEEISAEDNSSHSQHSNWIPPVADGWEQGDDDMYEREQVAQWLQSHESMMPRPPPGGSPKGLVLEL